MGRPGREIRSATWLSPYRTPADEYRKNVLRRKRRELSAGRLHFSGSPYRPGITNSYRCGKAKSRGTAKWNVGYRTLRRENRPSRSRSLAEWRSHASRASRIKPDIAQVRRTCTDYREEDRMTCDVCRREFTPESDEQRRCSDLCREIARSFRHRPTTELYGYWKQRTELFVEYCPVTGKRRYRTKKEAKRSERIATVRRYSGTNNWLRVYYCDDCYSWHLTSKPLRAQSPASSSFGEPPTPE